MSKEKVELRRTFEALAADDLGGMRARIDDELVIRRRPAGHWLYAALGHSTWSPSGPTPFTG